MKSEKDKEKKSLKRSLRRIGSSNLLLWRDFSLLMVAIIFAVALISFIVLSNAFFSQAKRRIENIAEKVCVIVGDDALSHIEKERAVTNCELVYSADIFVIDGQGTPLIPYRFATPVSWDSVVEGVFSRSGDWEESKSVIYSSSAEGASTLNYVSCVTFDGEQCRVLIRISLNSMMNVVRQTQIYVVVIAAVAILSSMVLSYFIAVKLSRPLREMSKTAKELAAGDYSVEFTSTQYSEIADLSTALNYMKDEIKKSDDFQKELLANVTHDLKTPLTMIKAYASMVQEISGDDPKKRDEHLQVIIDESDRLTGLVDDVLSTSKISSGIARLNKKVFNLTEFLYGVINKFNYLTETQGYNIMVDVDANLYTYADEEKIGQVLYNLISNAVNYTGEDKTVYITLKFSVEEDRIKFAVRDTGKGISDDELIHIWDRYYRSNDTHTRPIKGTGLGLNIVKVILKEHSFNFGVTTKEGYGSTFFVDFPAVDSEV